MPRLFLLNRYEDTHMNDEEVYAIVGVYVVAEVKLSRPSQGKIRGQCEEQGRGRAKVKSKLNPR